MSENVMSSGHMLPLSRKITREEREEWSELLWDQDSDVSFNYEGTLAYTDHREFYKEVKRGIVSTINLSRILKGDL